MKLLNILFLNKYRIRNRTFLFYLYINRIENHEESLTINTLQVKYNTKHHYIFPLFTFAKNIQWADKTA